MNKGVRSKKKNGTTKIFFSSDACAYVGKNIKKKLPLSFSGCLSRVAEN